MNYHSIERSCPFSKTKPGKVRRGERLTRIGAKRAYFMGA